jgi:zinc transporter, ZIP family
MQDWLPAGLWGLLAGSALLIGAVLGYFIRVPKRIVAAIMAFGSGVLTSALSFELMDEAYERGGFVSTGIGFLAGGAVYTLANWLLCPDEYGYHNPNSYFGKVKVVRIQ